MKKRSVKVADFEIGEGQPLALISGPCVIESEEHALQCAVRLKEMCSSRHLNLIYKSSYDKANRMSVKSYRGVGADKGLRILERIKRELNLPIVTDIHTPEEAAAAAEVCDILQIPAFLCRQTDLLLAAAKTGRVIHLKKGQFVAPWDMGPAVEKIRSQGNDQIILVDRGSCFGYNQLVSDFRAIPVMQNLGCPVTFDVSHSLQQPGGGGHCSGGERHHTPMLSRAAVAAGADCVYIESHPDPERALSDAATVYPLDQMAPLLKTLERLRQVVCEA